MEVYVLQRPNSKGPAKTMDQIIESSIGVRGNLKLTLTDDKTGEVLQVDEGPNLVLNTGIEDLCHLMAGDTNVPADLVAGQRLHLTTRALPHVPIYGQFGTSGVTPASNDVSQYANGTLDLNTISPTYASDIIKASAYYPLSTTVPPISNQITVQFTLSPNKGNGPGGTDITYREAVLMSKVADSPTQYRWFARRVFADIIKNSTSILTAEWCFTFIVSRA